MQETLEIQGATLREPLIFHTDYSDVWEGGRGFACLTLSNDSKLIKLKFEKKYILDSAKIIMNCNGSPCDTLGRLRSTM